MDQTQFFMSSLLLLVTTTSCAFVTLCRSLRKLQKLLVCVINLKHVMPLLPFLKTQGVNVLDFRVVVFFERAVFSAL